MDPEPHATKTAKIPAKRGRPPKPKPAAVAPAPVVAPAPPRAQRWEDDGGPYAELLEDPERGIKVPCSALLHIEIVSVPLDPQGHELEPAFVSRVPPETLLVDLPKLTGAGRFKCYGRGKDGTFLFYRYRRVEGVIAAAKGAAQPFGPLFETAGGLLAVGGLDPMAQTLLALMQSTVAMIREETAGHTAALVEIVRAVCARPEPTHAERVPADLAMLRQIMDAQQQRMAETHRLLEAERETSHRLALEKARSASGRESPTDRLLGKLTEHVDTAAGVLAARLAPDQAKMGADGRMTLALTEPLDAARAALTAGKGPADIAAAYVNAGMKKLLVPGVGGMSEAAQNAMVEEGLSARADPEAFARRLGWSPPAAP